MKRILIGFAIALIVEVAASFWVWERQPSHGLVDIYDESFLRYEAERVVPWLIAAIILFGLWFIFERRSLR